MKTLGELFQSCLGDAYPSVGVFCTPLVWQRSGGLCWLPMLQCLTTVLVLSSDASVLCSRGGDQQHEAGAGEVRPAAACLQQDRGHFGQ